MTSPAPSVKWKRLAAVARAVELLAVGQRAHVVDRHAVARLGLGAGAGLQRLDLQVAHRCLLAVRGSRVVKSARQATPGRATSRSFPLVWRDSSARCASPARAERVTVPCTRTVSSPRAMAPSTAPGALEELRARRDVVAQRRARHEERAARVEDLQIERRHARRSTARRATSMPRGRRQRRLRSKVRAPTESYTTSTPRPPVRARHDLVERPRACRRRPRRRRPRARAPPSRRSRPCRRRGPRRAWRSGRAGGPTPPAAAWTRHVSPGSSGKVTCAR